MSDPLRILLIDDNPDDCLLVIRELRREFPDLQVEQIIEAEGFAQALEAGDFDLVITDYQLRWTDGLAVLRAVKARWPDCPVIMFTGTGSEEIAVEAMKAGLDDYVLKSPKHFIRLPAAVRSALKRAEDSIERKRAEEALREVHAELSAIYASAPIAMMLVDRERQVRKANVAAAQFAGRPAEEMVGLRGGEALRCLHSLDDPKGCGFGPFCETCLVRRTVLDTFETGNSHNEVEAKLPFAREEKQEERWLLVSTVLVRAGETEMVLVSTQDITERKRAEEEIRRLSQFRESIIDSANVWLDVLDEKANVVIWNRAAEEISGYFREEVVGHGKIWEWLYPDEEYRSEITAEAAAIIEKGEVVEDFETTIRRKDGQTRIISWNSRNLLDEKGNPIGSIALGRDITERRQAEEELQHTLERLREALGGIIQTVTLTVEVKDPYTAGHQQRVGNLARAIANEMGLPQEQIDGIRMAGLIHDLGKIGIPAEILSKPGRLSDFEWGIIKMHSQIGYDILKKIDFSWPVAQIVLQHHERLDGSGYPAGLVGEEIILEARILGVADVVEAMASFRPYRPARGLDKALGEISQNRGVLYDPEVVDACLKLFTEKGFEF